MNQTRTRRLTGVGQKSLLDAPATSASIAAPPRSASRPANQCPAPLDTRRAANYSLNSEHYSRMLDRVRNYILAQGLRGATDEETRAGLEMRESTARARRVELAAAGLIEDSGQRRRTSSGRLAVCWVAVGHPTAPAKAVRQEAQTCRTGACISREMGQSAKPSDSAKLPAGWGRAILAEATALARTEAIAGRRGNGQEHAGELPVGKVFSTQCEIEAGAANAETERHEPAGNARLRPCNRHTRFWVSMHGQLICGECHPPPHIPGITRRWIELPLPSDRAAANAAELPATEQISVSSPVFSRR